MRGTYLLCLALSASGSFVPSPVRLGLRGAACRHAPLLCKLSDDAAPSDIDYEFDPAVEPFPADAFPLEAESEGSVAVMTEPSGPPNAERTRLAADLLALAAGCSRGEAASADDLSAARSLVTALEGLNPTAEPTLSPECVGTWELVFSDTQLFRSSPFFMAGRAVCEDGSQAAQYDWFCDMHRAALAISTIGKVRQVVSKEAVVSEFEVSAGAVPFLSDALPFVRYSGGLPLTIQGSIVSTASIEANLGGSWRLLMDTVEIKGSNIPLLRQALDAGLKLQSRDLGRRLEELIPSYANPRPLFRTTYLDGQMRISRDQDGKIFVYVKRSAETQPKTYATSASDLGVGALLSGVGKGFFGSGSASAEA